MKLRPDAPPQSRLDDTVRNAPPHLRPVWQAVSEGRCSHLFVSQGIEEFEVPAGRLPVITLLGDDMLTALGPNGFHKPSLVPVVRRSQTVLIASGMPDALLYRRICTNAVLAGQDVIIVETQPYREMEWIAFLKEHRPDITTVVHTPRNEGTAH